MLLSVDFHTHTIASPDSLNTPERIVDILRRGKPDRIVVTDHDTIAGARAAYALDPEHVIIGEEILTTRGEILAAYVTKEVPPRLSPQETIRRLRDQRAFISVSHPFDRLRRGAWKLEDLLEIAPLVDAIETFNARCMFAADNARAGEFARLHHLAATAGSDGHAAFEIGRAVVVLPQFQGSEELRKVISQGKVQGKLSPPWVHFASRYASLRKKVV
jgi:predicted metal-dependent phosphoesterase TrpH